MIMMAIIAASSTNFSITSLDGPPVAKLTITITSIAIIKAGKSSYIPNIPPSFDIPYFHTNIIIPPVIIPDIIPYLLAFFQNKAHKTTGPNVAPKPAHANDTISNTELSGFDANIICLLYTSPSPRDA